MSEPIEPDVLEWLRSECNRASYGQCSVLRCMKRGGYEHGKSAPNTDMATCKAWEALSALKEKALPS